MASSGHTACPGPMGGLCTELDVQFTDGDLGHGFRVHLSKLIVVVFDFLSKDTIQGHEFCLQHREIFINLQNTDFFAIMNKNLRSIAISPLRPGLQQKWRTPWWLARQDGNFGVPHFSWYISLLSRNLPNTFVDFQHCQFLTKLKITPPIGQKVVWQKF